MIKIAFTIFHSFEQAVKIQVLDLTSAGQRVLNYEVFTLHNKRKKVSLF